MYWFSWNIGKRSGTKRISHFRDLFKLHCPPDGIAECAMSSSRYFWQERNDRYAIGDDGNCQPGKSRSRITCPEEGISATSIPFLDYFCLITLMLVTLPRGAPGVQCGIYKKLGQRQPWVEAPRWGVDIRYSGTSCRRKLLKT